MDRRKFLTILAATVATGATAQTWPTSAQQETPTTNPPTDMGEEAFTFFTEPEVRFIEAAIDRLIPADDLGPGALAAGVAVFIDRQLDGTFGHAGRYYEHGPWGQSSGLQGYQLPLAPRDLFRVGIAATDRYCQEALGQPFAGLEPTQQDDVLKGLQDVADAVELQDVPGAIFFAHLILLTKDGFFADPIYGGNRDMLGWKLVGFPGVAADYTDWIRRTDEPYPAQPVSIKDMQAGIVPRDHHGHPVHRFADAGSVIRTQAPEPKPGVGRHARVPASFHGIVRTENV
jgi:gluconate 2-dehydrogenase gamma chain